MDNQLFRQKSIDRISSPEELHDYMRVTSPRLWMILGAVAVLLIGFIVYASTARMENIMKIRVTVKSVENTEENRAESGNLRPSYVVCSLPISKLETVKAGMPVRIGSERGKVGWISTSSETGELLLVIDMEHEQLPLPDGEYDAEMVLESTTPISFLWN